MILYFKSDPSLEAKISNKPVVLGRQNPAVIRKRLEKQNKMKTIKCKSYIFIDFLGDRN